MKQNKCVVEMRNLTIGYLKKKTVKVVSEGINAQILGGELTCLLGANGIGKSTLLRTLSAFQPKISGEIFFHGNEIETFKEKDLSKLVSVVLTDRLDIKNMSVYDLVSLGRSPYTGFWGRLAPDDIDKVSQAISLVNIDHLTNRLIDTLSDGERQKVMIAKALAQDTSIVFLDEPTAFLDFPSKVEIMQLLHRLSRETKKTIFLSTHDLELALQIADKIWLMDDHAHIHIGTPEDLSLNGDLSHFFARKGILFDKDTGLFRVENDFNRKIRLVGHGQKYAMIRKALMRNGVLAERNIEAEDCIEIVNNQFGFTRSGCQTVWVETIEELLNVIE